MNVYVVRDLSWSLVCLFALKFLILLKPTLTLFPLRLLYPVREVFAPPPKISGCNLTAAFFPLQCSWPRTTTPHQLTFAVLAVVHSLSHVQLLVTHELKHARLLCPSLFPWVWSKSCPLSQWCYPTISSSVTFSSCPQFFPAWGSFSMSQLFALVAKVLELQHQSLHWIFRVDFL